MAQFNQKTEVYSYGKSPVMYFPATSTFIDDNGATHIINDPMHTMIGPEFPMGSVVLEHTVDGWKVKG